MSKSYVAVVEKEPDSAFGVWFPDFPGCFFATNAFDDMPASASAALRQHVEAMQSARYPVRAPRSIDNVRLDGDVKEPMALGATLMLVQLLVDAGRTA